MLSRSTTGETRPGHCTHQGLPCHKMSNRDGPPQALHPSLPPNPNLPANPTLAAKAFPAVNARSPAPPLSPPRGGFTRDGFAPIRNRHADRVEYETMVGPEMGRGRDGPREREREFPRRELDPEPERGWERRDDFAARGRWEGEYDRPKRRRSPSPIHSSHRPRHRSPSPSFYPAPPDPASLDTLLPFRQFAEWFRHSHPQTAKADDDELRRYRADQGDEAKGRERVGMGKRYERYKKEFISRQLFALYLTHRSSAWFTERYSPAPQCVDLRKRLNRQGRIPRVEDYIAGLRNGDFDAVSYDLSDYKDKKPSMVRQPSDVDGMDKALGEGGVTNGDEGLKVEIPPRDKQVFVKTVPPQTSRKDLEALFEKVPGFQYLALSEPAARKSFHRVGWAQFGDHVDMDQAVKVLDSQRIDNFTFHMVVNATPTIGRIRTTPPIANSLERLEIDGEKARLLAIKLEDELIDEKPDGDEENKVSLQERASGVVEDNIMKLLEKNRLDGELDEHQRVHKAKIIVDQWISYLRTGLSTCYYCVAPMSFPDELQRKCIGHLRADEELETVPEGDEPHKDVDGDGDDRETRGKEDKRDEAKERRDEAKERRDEAKERRAINSANGNEKWIEAFEMKIKPLFESVNVVDYGGRDIDEETKKLCAPLIKQEEAQKYRCKECQKLFKAPEFVIKHVLVKHPEVVKGKIDDLTVLNNYVVDPQRTQPTATTPAAVEDQILLPLPTLPILPFPEGGFHPEQGFNGTPNELMMQQMMMMQMQSVMMAQAQQMGQGGLADRMGGYANDLPPVLPLPPAPPGGEDPRARRGRVSYKDLDETGGAGAGDGGLPY
ncbi:hypothetical protein P7C73_g3283, partial [Tremellales sp. Uapishka_1]